jgi:hypothetical protein
LTTLFGAARYKAAAAEEEEVLKNMAAEIPTPLQQAT